MNGDFSCIFPIDELLNGDQPLVIMKTIILEMAKLLHDKLNDHFYRETPCSTYIVVEPYHWIGGLYQVMRPKRCNWPARLGPNRHPKADPIFQSLIFRHMGMSENVGLIPPMK